MFCSRWCCSIRLWFLLPEPPLLITESRTFQLSTIWIRGVAESLHHCLLLWGNWCLDTASVVGVTAWGTKTVGSSTTSMSSWVAGSTSMRGEGGWEGSPSRRSLCCVKCCQVRRFHHCGRVGAEGIGSQAQLLLLLSYQGCKCHCRQEARVLCNHLPCSSWVP